MRPHDLIGRRVRLIDSGLTGENVEPENQPHVEFHEPRGSGVGAVFAIGVGVLAGALFVAYVAPWMAGLIYGWGVG